MGDTLKQLLQGLTVDELRTVTRQAEEVIAKSEAEAKAVKFGKAGEVVTSTDGCKATWGRDTRGNAVVLFVNGACDTIRYDYVYGVTDLAGSKAFERVYVSTFRARWLQSDSKDPISTPSVATGVLRLLLAQDRLPGVAN